MLLLVLFLGIATYWVYISAEKIVDKRKQEAPPAAAPSNPTPAPANPSGTPANPTAAPAPSMTTPTERMVPAASS